MAFKSGPSQAIVFAEKRIENLVPRSNIRRCETRTTSPVSRIMIMASHVVEVE